MILDEKSPFFNLFEVQKAFSEVNEKAIANVC
jgi:hypothetical protein